MSLFSIMLRMPTIDQIIARTVFYNINELMLYYKNFKICATTALILKLFQVWRIRNLIFVPLHLKLG